MNLFKKIGTKLVTSIFKSGFEKTRKKYGLGKQFESGNCTCITSSISDEVIGKIYIPINIFLDDEGKYYLVHKDSNELLYFGLIDREGLINTINKDLSTLSELYNYILAYIIDDKEMLEKLENFDYLLKVYKQVKLGEQYLKENNHI